MSRHNVLIVDDEIHILNALRRSLSEDFCIFTAQNIKEANKIIATNKVDIVLCDYNLNEEVNGVDFLESIKNEYTCITRVLLTAYKDYNIASSSLNKAGIFRYINKPWDDAELKLELLSGIQRTNLIKENKRIVDQINVSSQDIERVTHIIERDIKLTDKKLKHKIEGVNTAKELLNANNELVSKLAVTDDLSELIAIINQGIKKIINSDYTCILEYSDNDGTLKIYGPYGEYNTGIGLEKDFADLLRSFNSQAYNPVILNSVYAKASLKKLFFNDDNVTSLIVYPIQNNSDLTVSKTFFLVLGRIGNNEFVKQDVLLLKDVLTAIKVAMDRIMVSGRIKTGLKQWSETFDSIQDPLFIINPDYTIARVNLAVEKMLGLNRNIVAGELCYKIFKSSNDICEDCICSKTISLKKSHYSELTPCFNKKGLSCSSYPVFDENGDLSCVIQYNNDKSAEYKLYRQLIQAEKLASIGLLASNIAHEINNPVGGILAYSQLIKTELAQDDLLFSDMKEIESACLRCKDIIANLLNFSRDSSNDAKSRVCLQQIISTTIPLLRMCLRNIELIIEDLDGELYVNGNLGQLQQVVFNLIRNATDASTPGSKIFIRTGRLSNNSYISVKDQGSGISKELLPNIFDAFFTTKDSGKGTGLGLFIAYGIIRDHSGSITVDSEEGLGTEFRVLLPTVV